MDVGTKSSSYRCIIRARRPKSKFSCAAGNAAFAKNWMPVNGATSADFSAVGNPLVAHHAGAYH